MKIYLVLTMLTAFVLIGCGSKESAPTTPSESLKQYVAASQRQDIDKMKSLLSKGSLDLIEKAAKAQNSTTDEILQKESTVKIKNAPETRNEIIEGETATVEVKNETNGEFDLKMPFVKEDGIWKLARDKYIEEMMKKANDARNKLIQDVTNASNANNNSASNITKEAANK